MIVAFSFQQLVELCQLTHADLQARAVRSVDTALVVRNWLFGWYIVEFEQNGIERATYGKATLKKLSQSLKELIGRGFSVDSLEQMRRFFLAYPLPESVLVNSETVSRILTAEWPKASYNSRAMSLNNHYSPAEWKNLSGQLIQHFTLGWSHYVTLLTIDNPDERRFYEIETKHNYWTVRELERQISSSLYERLVLSRNKDEIRKLAEQGQIIEKPADIIKNPVVLEFLGMEEKHTYMENELESAIIDKLESFLLELGKGFLFEARQKRFTFDNDHFYVDLVFYNRLLRCYVLIDLKRDKLTHQDLGQIQMYVNYFDRFIKTDDELPTIGIILCRRKNDALVELALPRDTNIFASKYQLYLPSKEELKARLEQIEAELGNG